MSSANNCRPATDLTLNPSPFFPENITPETNDILNFLQKSQSQQPPPPKWYEVGAAKYRQMWEDGSAGLPKPVYLDDLLEARDKVIASRDEGRNIPVRVFTPANGGTGQGIFLHIHGGGCVLGNHRHQDHLLRSYSDTLDLTSISVGYRLAPENPYPAAINDCIDVAEYLISQHQIHQNQRKNQAQPASLTNTTNLDTTSSNAIGSNLPLYFIGGESAGGYLTSLLAFHILRHHHSHSQYQLPLKALVFKFAQFDLTNTSPSVQKSLTTPILNLESIRQFNKAYIPNSTLEQLRTGEISPIYDSFLDLPDPTHTPQDTNKSVVDRVRIKLPPALFICGTLDPLLDDTLLMSCKWMMTGSDAVVKFFEGGVHGFTLLRESGLAIDCQRVVLDFLRRYIHATIYY